jgi:hypothetical protein
VGKSDSDAGFALHGFFFYVSGADPITSIARYCARAASGHAIATPPSSVINSRRPMKKVI